MSSQSKNRSSMKFKKLSKREQAEQQQREKQQNQGYQTTESMSNMPGIADEDEEYKQHQQDMMRPSGSSFQMLGSESEITTDMQNIHNNIQQNKQYIISEMIEEGFFSESQGGNQAQQV